MIDVYKLDDDPGSEAINYKTSMDMEHFRRLLQKAEVEEEKQKGRHQLSHSMAEKALQKTLDQITRDTGWLCKVKYALFFIIMLLYYHHVILAFYGAYLFMHTQCCNENC